MTNPANEEARRRYGALFDNVSAILFRLDPMGINFDVNTDEYDPEARTILPRLTACQSENDVLEVVYSEFQFWFGDCTGPATGFRDAANEIWELWQRHGNRI